MDHRVSTPKQIARRLVRSVAYSAPLWKWLDARGVGSGSGGPAEAAEYWDKALDTDFAFYRGGNYFTDVRNAIVTETIRSHAPGARSVLDVGCASGSLSEWLRPIGVTDYFGIDASPKVIADADRARGRFEAADLRTFVPPDEHRFDVIVFNEVLYYLRISEAVESIGRYEQFLTERGVVCISMTDDPKARRITKEILRSRRWINGLVYQQLPAKARFTTNSLLPRPHLVGLVRPTTTAASRS